MFACFELYTAGFLRPQTMQKKTDVCGGEGSNATPQKPACIGSRLLLFHWRLAIFSLEVMGGEGMQEGILGSFPDFAVVLDRRTARHPPKFAPHSARAREINSGPRAMFHGGGRHPGAPTLGPSSF